MISEVFHLAQSSSDNAETIKSRNSKFNFKASSITAISLASSIRYYFFIYNCF